MGMAAQQQLAVQVAATCGHTDVDSVTKLLLSSSAPMLSVASGSSGDENTAATITVTGKKQQLAVACLLHWALNCPPAASAATDATSAPIEGVNLSVRCVQSHLVHFCAACEAGRLCDAIVC